jgi:hypothetical protein
VSSRLEVFADLVAAELADSSVVTLVGKKKLAEHDQVRRIVWLRSEKACTVRFADRKVGGQKFGTESLEANAPEVLRENQTLDRVETADVHIRAEDSEALELLFDAFCTALTDAAPGALYGFAAGFPYVWTEDEFHAQRCPLIVLTVTFRVPVATETKKLVIVRATTHECRIIGDE